MMKMKAWVAKAYGGPDVLELVEASLPEPEADQVTIEVRAAGVNPADYKMISAGEPAGLPRSLGLEVAGVIAAVGSAVSTSGPLRVGDEVIAYQIADGYSSMINVAACKTYAKPSPLSFAAAANLLLAGSTAAEMLDAVELRAGDVIVLHGAAGAVGTSVMQQAREMGVVVLGTASERNFDLVRRYGGIPVAYGPGLLERLLEADPRPIVAALDTAGTDEAVDASLALVSDARQLVSIVAFGRAGAEGYQTLGAANPASARFRADVVPSLIDAAAAGLLEVPVTRTFAFAEAPEALNFLRAPHPAGKIALVGAVRAEDDGLTDVVGQQLRRVAEAPNVTDDGARIRQEASDGATAETMIEANIMLEDQAYRAQLESLEAASKADDRAESSGAGESRD